MAEKIVLADLDNPKFELQLPDGSSREYELWDLIDKIQEIEKQGNLSTIKGQVKAIRELFGFPLPEDFSESRVKPFTLSNNQAIALNKKLAEILTEKTNAEKKARGSNVK